VKPLQIEKWLDPGTGTSTGRLGRPDSLMRAVETLVKGASVDAIAVVARFPDDSVDDLVDYRQGQVRLVNSRCFGNLIKFIMSMQVGTSPNNFFYCSLCRESMF